MSIRYYYIVARYLSFLSICGYVAFLTGNSLLAQASEHSVAATKLADIKHIVSELEICPCWLYVPPSDIRTRKHITKIYADLSSYDSVTLRDGVRELSKGPDDPLDNNAKVFALSRILFQVPQRYVNTGRRFVLMGNPFYKDGSVDLLWPYSVDSHGKLVLTGGDGKFNFGGVLADELADFDHIAATFPRRSKEEKSGN